MRAIIDERFHVTTKRSGKMLPNPTYRTKYVDSFTKAARHGVRAFNAGADTVEITMPGPEARVLTYRWPQGCVDLKALI